MSPGFYKEISRVSIIKQSPGWLHMRSSSHCGMRSSLLRALRWCAGWRQVLPRKLVQQEQRAPDLPMSREPQRQAHQQPPLLRAGANKLVRAPGALPDQLMQRAAQHQAHQPQQTQAKTPVSPAAAGPAAAAAGRPAAVPQRQQQPRSKTWTRPAPAQHTNAADVGPSQARAALHAPAVPARPVTLAFGAPRQQSQRHSKTWTRSGAAAAMQQQQAHTAAGQTATGQTAAAVAAKPRLLPAQAAAATQAATSAATMPAAATLPNLRANKPAVHNTLPASKGGKTVTVLSGGVSGGQQRLLVYKKGKRGKSLQRTAVKAAARGGLTWRNPACPGATAVGGIVSGSRPASGQPAVAAGVPPPPPAPGPSNSSGSGTAAASMLHRRRSGKWHKYVRAAAKVLITDPAALRQAITARASSPAGGPGRKQQSLGSGAMAMGRGGSKLLRLGGDLYKVRCGWEERAHSCLGLLVIGGVLVRHPATVQHPAGLRHNSTKAQLSLPSLCHRWCAARASPSR